MQQTENKEKQISKYPPSRFVHVKDMTQEEFGIFNRKKELCDLYGYSGYAGRIIIAEPDDRTPEGAVLDYYDSMRDWIVLDRKNLSSRWKYCKALLGLMITATTGAPKGTPDYEREQSVVIANLAERFLLDKKKEGAQQ